MFSLFRKSVAPESVMPGFSHQRAMSLPERMAFRARLMDQVIVEVLAALRGVDGQVSHRCMPADARHHRFVIVFDVTPGFRPLEAGHALERVDVEARIRERAYRHFGLVVDGVYWRHQSGPGLSTAAGRRPADFRQERPVWELVSEEEKQALMQAIRAGGELPSLHVGDLEYQTDLTPLEPPVRR